MQYWWSFTCLSLLITISACTWQCFKWRQSVRSHCAPDRLSRDCTIGVYNPPMYSWALASDPSRIRSIKATRQSSEASPLTIRAGFEATIIHTSLHKNTTDIIVIFSDNHQLIPFHWDSLLINAINEQGCAAGHRLNNTIFHSTV